MRADGAPRGTALRKKTNAAKCLFSDARVHYRGETAVVSDFRPGLQICQLPDAELEDVQVTLGSADGALWSLSGPFGPLLARNHCFHNVL